MIGVDGITNLISTAVTRIWPDKTKIAELDAELSKMAKSGELEVIASKFGVIQAEANSKHFITAAWRPITMLTFVAIIANNYLLYPYLSLFWNQAPVLDIPPDMWGLLKIGLGGYVVGRSAEKIVSAVQEPAK
jgi:hypothetical protein|tara:strand:+ start:729 stop:1127 length:399 start_codon:yes stop_codon:yes gene_type:complete